MELQGSDGQFLSIERAGFEGSQIPDDEDLLLNVTVKVHGYSATDQAWVPDEFWRKFLAELRTLERTRHGQAALEAANPRDLSLIFNTTDHAGHMAVSGFMGWEIPDGFYQKMEFGFAFDPGMLQTLICEFENF
jgi:hypothetical protein